MKTLISICSAVGLITTLPLMAEANTCSESLLSLPAHENQVQLQLSTWQVQRLVAIQHDTNHRRLGLQRKLDQVQLELDQLRRMPHDPVALGNMERQQAALIRRLDHITGRASSQALMLLNPWQRNRCEQRRLPQMAMLVEPAPPPPAPHVVVVRRPRPKVLKRARPSKHVFHGTPQHVYQLPPRHQRRAGKGVVVHRAPPAPKPAPPRRKRSR